VVYDDGLMPLIDALAMLYTEGIRDGCAQASVNLLHALCSIPILAISSFTGYRAGTMVDIAMEAEAVTRDVSDEVLERSKDTEKRGSIRSTGRRSGRSNRRTSARASVVEGGRRTTSMDEQSDGGAAKGNGAGELGNVIIAEDDDSIESHNIKRRQLERVNSALRGLWDE
jgi:hypothetical protein